jgi:hypothetical protein
VDPLQEDPSLKYILVASQVIKSQATPPEGKVRAEQLPKFPSNGLGVTPVLIVEQALSPYIWNCTGPDTTTPATAAVATFDTVGALVTVGGLAEKKASELQSVLFNAALVLLWISAAVLLSSSTDVIEVAT